MTAPRFQDDKIALRKQQMLQAMKERNDESAAIEEREHGFLAFGDNFWANRYSDGRLRGLHHSAPTWRQFHQQWFHPANFVVAASGDFDRDQMVQKLEALFADWPFKGEAPPPIPTNTTFAATGVYLVDKDVNQGRVAMMLPGILRDNPDYFAVVDHERHPRRRRLHLAHHEPRALRRGPGLRRPFAVSRAASIIR